MEIEQPAEGKLLEQARTQVRVSIRSAAKKSGISEGRWRQIEKGYQSVGGTRVPVSAPPATLMRMATVVGISADELSEAGREDAAALMGMSESPVDPADEVQRVQEWAEDPLRRPLPADAVFAFVSDADLIAEVGSRLSEDGYETRLSTELPINRSNETKTQVEAEVARRLAEIQRQEPTDATPTTHAGVSPAADLDSHRPDREHATPSEDAEPRQWAAHSEQTAPQQSAARRDRQREWDERGEGSQDTGSDEPL